MRTERWAVIMLFLNERYKSNFWCFLCTSHPKTLYNTWISHISFYLKKLLKISLKYELKILYGNAFFSHLIISPNMIFLVLNFKWAKSDHYHLTQILSKFKSISSLHFRDTGFSNWRFVLVSMAIFFNKNVVFRK